MTWGTLAEEGVKVMRSEGLKMLSLGHSTALQNLFPQQLGLPIIESEQGWTCQLPTIDHKVLILPVALLETNGI